MVRQSGKCDAQLLQVAAERALISSQWLLAVGMTQILHQALTMRKRFWELHRTLLALSAAYSLWLMSQSFYSQLQIFALNRAGAI